MYANEAENHLLNFSLRNDVKENWQHLKDIILKVGYTLRGMLVGIRCLVSM